MIRKYPTSTSAAVSAVMRANYRRNTKPELALRRRLHAAGLRYRVDRAVSVVSGRKIRPDIVFGPAKVAVPEPSQHPPDRQRVPATRRSPDAFPRRRGARREVHRLFARRRHERRRRRGRAAPTGGMAPRRRRATDHRHPPPRTEGTPGRRQRRLLGQLLGCRPGFLWPCPRLQGARTPRRRARRQREVCARTLPRTPLRRPVPCPRSNSSSVATRTSSGKSAGRISPAV